MTLRRVIKEWTPPALLEARRRLLGQRLHFADEPAGWASAQRKCEGYAADVIVARVAAATREVLAGRARFERDSVLFQQADFRYPILAALLRAAALNAGRLEVVDFGGSLGSTYRQCQPFLTGLPGLRWRIVEQAGFATLGQAEFTTDELSFFQSVQELPAAGLPPVVLLSSVLQYLEQPEQILDDLLALRPSHLVIDRTPLAEREAHHLSIQRVPKAVYAASYPCWILSRPRLLAQFSDAGYQVLADFPCAEGLARTAAGVGFEFRGLLMEKKP